MTPPVRPHARVAKELLVSNLGCCSNSACTGTCTDAGAREVVGNRDLAEQRRLLCAQALEIAVEFGFVAPDFDARIFVGANEVAAERLLLQAGYDSELVLSRWRKALDDVKVGHLKRRDDISLAWLLRLLPQIESFERRAKIRAIGGGASAGTANVEPLRPEMQTIVDELREQERAGEVRNA